jgi:hypothetical protein
MLLSEAGRWVVSVAIAVVVVALVDPNSFGRRMRLTFSLAARTTSVA